MYYVEVRSVTSDECVGYADYCDYTPLKEIYQDLRESFSGWDYAIVESDKPGGPWFEIPAGPMHNKDLLFFVNGPLNDCMRAAYPNIRQLSYVENFTESRRHVAPAFYRQAVIIEFHNGYKKIANVEGDSEWSCIEDVMKRIAR